MVIQVVLAPLALLVACTGTDVGNGAIDIDFSIHDSQETSARKRSTARVAPAGLEVTDAWVVVERIRLRNAAECDGGSEAEFVGPFAVDMLAAGTPAELRGLEVSFVDYCRFELRWDSLDEGDLPTVPSELVGASILIGGTRADGTSFVLRSRRGDELRLDARTGSFTLDDMTSALFVAFDIQVLFDEIALDSAEIGGDGVIRIEQGSNDDLLDTFDDNLAAAAKLFDDDDGDRELDPEERDSTDVLAEWQP